MYKLSVLLLAFTCISCSGGNNEHLQVSLHSNIDSAPSTRGVLLEEQNREEITIQDPLSLSALVIPTTSFESQWFTVDYPITFTARPQGPTDKKDRVITDEAYFIAPDKSVELFVYAPFQGEEPGQYTQVLDTEEVIETATESIENQEGEVEMLWTTVRAKDRSYYRSFTSKRVNGMYQAFGITYTDQEAYDIYKDVYVRFTKSMKSTSQRL